ncbi:MAG: hypothetical protein GY772_28020 [bacterium]|nr:hypothetical protein [bacterium]
MGSDTDGSLGLAEAAVGAAPQPSQDEATGFVARAEQSTKVPMLPNEKAARLQWETWFGHPAPLFEGQKHLQKVVDERLFNNFLASVSGAEKARYLSLLLPGSSGWLTALPSPQLGLHLKDSSAQIALRMWLGLPQPGLPKEDPKGYDALSATGALVNGRHNDVRDAIWALLRRFDPRCRIEAYSPDVAHEDRPGDILAPALLQRGQCAYLDVAIGNPVQKSLLSRAQGHQGAAGNRLIASKNRKRGALAVRKAGDAFIPVVAEAFGGWMPESFGTLQTIARFASSHLCDEYGLTLKRLLERLSVIIMRGSSAMVARAMHVTNMGDEWDEPC